MTSDKLSPLTVYVAKLERRRALPAEARDALLALPAHVRQVEAHDVVLKEGRKADHCVFLLQGLISRQKRAGRTPQIISISVPGDAVDMQTLFFHETDHALVAHEPTIVAEVSHGALIRLCDEHPLLAKLIWHDTLVDSAIFREWAMNIGHRRAPERIGFLFLELEARFAAIGRVPDDAFELNLTQQELASALGLSLVHMNKSLRRLRDDGLIATRGREIRFLEKPRLAELVSFDDGYLRIDRAPDFDKAAG